MTRTEALLNARFDRLDEDGNGIIDEKDYLAVPRRLAEIVGSDNEGVQRLEQAYQALWWRLLEQRDADGDGRVTREEFVEANAEALAKDGYERWLAPIVNAYVVALDSDGDRALNVDELSMIGNAGGVDPADTAKALKLADTDYDGILSADELHRLAREFYSEAPTDAATVAIYHGIGI